jgi:hypothetical protein
VRSRDPWRGNPNIHMRASTSSSPDQLYLIKLGDSIEVGPLQLAHHVSHYVESTFSQFYQEDLIDVAHKVWWQSNHPDDSQPPPSLDAVLSRFFDRLKAL